MIRTFKRRSARVEAMRLESEWSLEAAADWLSEHGINAYVLPTCPCGGPLHIHAGDSGEIATARLGQWLTYDPETREFAVYDGGADRPADHEEVSADV